MNIGVDWGIHFSLNDELDGVKDPYGIKSSGLWKTRTAIPCCKSRSPTASAQSVKRVIKKNKNS